MQAARRGIFSEGGFTLIEIIAALAILSTGLMVLMESHYNAMSLFAMVRDEADAQRLLEEAAAMAEMGVLRGNLTGDGDFGRRHRGIAWRYEAERPYDAIPMYAVEVTVTGLAAPASAEFRTFAVQKE